MTTDNATELRAGSKGVSTWVVVLVLTALQAAESIGDFQGYRRGLDVGFTKGALAVLKASK